MLFRSVQTEGFGATKQVDPNMVIKKKNGNDVEVQEGWLGRIIPFELVQETLLHEEATALKEKEERLTQVTAEQQEILDSLTEEEKEEWEKGEKRRELRMMRKEEGL